MKKNLNETIDIDLIGRVNSLKLAERNMLLPLFEAIINSIHSIEESKITNGHISIILGRENSIQFDDSDYNLPAVVKFTVIDNGIGFDENNYNSFKRAYSTYKVHIGGKGIGRFIWLKAFSNVNIESVYEENNATYFRKFGFNLKNIIENVSISKMGNSTMNETKVELCGFKDPFKEKCPKKADTIADRIIEHFIIYMFRKDCPRMDLIDGDTTINLNEQFRKITFGNIITETFSLRSYDFKLNLIKWYKHDELTYHKLSLCANRREVESFNLNKIILDLHTKIQDEETKKYYLLFGFIESEYFDKNINDERTEVLFSKDELFEDDLIKITELHFELEKVINKHFATVVTAFREKKLDALRYYIREKAPQYSILARHSGALESIVYTENLSDQDVELKLFRKYQDIDFDSRVKAKNIIQNNNDNNETPDQIREKHLEVLQSLTELSKSNLIEYVVHRKSILEIFEKSLGLNQSNHYEIEKTIHNIVFPTKKDSNDVLFEMQNLWLIDERLSFHTYLTSDKPLNSIEGLETNSTNRPDILVFNNPFSFIEGDEPPYNSVILIEFKRPMRDQYAQDNPIEQIYDYVAEIRKGKKLTKDGRNYPINDNTWFYTYLICDINEKIRRWANYAQLSPTYDGLGYYGYNKDLKCMIEILTFDQVLLNAKKRNKVLFHKLGLL